MPIARLCNWIREKISGPKMILPIARYAPDEIRGETRLFKKELMITQSSLFGRKIYWTGSVQEGMPPDQLQITTFVVLTNYGNLPTQSYYSSSELSRGGFPLGFIVRTEKLLPDGTSTITEETKPFQHRYF